MSPEEHLARALEAKTSRSRGLWAKRGLAARSRIDRTTQAMLLRQLYLSHFEQRQFARAFEVAEQALTLAVLPDVVHQDAARACIALGDLERGAGHLRLAARLGPPSRRAFHLWTLGSMFFLVGRYDEAIAALSRAARWGTRDKPLYQGHLVAARLANGERVSGLRKLLALLDGVPAGQGYGRFVLGQLAFHARLFVTARRYLEAFVERTESGRATLGVALERELALSKKILAELPPP